MSDHVVKIAGNPKVPEVTGGKSRRNPVHAEPVIQIGIDFGGTKIEAAALDPTGRFESRIRAATPGSYDAAIDAVRDVVAQAEFEAGTQGSIGVGTPGSVSPRTGLMRNSNALYLNGRRFREDLERALQRPVRMANDANCFALSESFDGAAKDARSVFALILGTGCGGGLVIDGRIVDGANGIGGEWGHVPLPWMRHDEFPGPKCWCGQYGCLETWISGSGICRDHEQHAGVSLDGEAIVEMARSGDRCASESLQRYIDRLARGIAMLANIIDPGTIVLGGGLSNIGEIYGAASAIVKKYTFADAWAGNIVQARWGDSSGVRGAARLWTLDSYDAGFE